MTLRQFLQLTRRLDDGDGQGAGRRLLVAGARTRRGAWTRIAPDAEPAAGALPGPWSLTLLLRGRPAGGSPP